MHTNISVALNQGHKSKPSQIPSKNNIQIPHALCYVWDEEVQN